MSTVTHITAGKASRAAVSSLLAFAYQDAGFEDVLNSGNLDAPDSAPAGSHVYNPKRNPPSRNSVMVQTVPRELGLSYWITVRDENDKPRSYSAIGDPRALEEAARDDGAMGFSIRVRQ